MSRALLLIVVLSLPRAVPSQSLIEEAVTGFLGRSSRMGRNLADMAGAGGGNQRPSRGILQELFDSPQQSAVLRPQDGTVIAGFVRGLMNDVDNEGNVNKVTLLHPDQHRMVGALLGGLASGRNTTPRPTTPPPQEEVIGLLESMARRRKAQKMEQARPKVVVPEPVPATTPPPQEEVIGLLESMARRRNAQKVEQARPEVVVLPPEPVATTAAPMRAAAVAPAAVAPALTAALEHDLNPVAVAMVVESAAPGVLDEFRRDVQRDAPECSEKAKAQMSKVLMNFRKGVLDCVGVEDADLGDVIDRLRQVLLSADRLPATLFANLERCSAAAANRTAAAGAGAGQRESSAITRIPPRPGKRQSGGGGSGADPGEVSAARCILMALAEARDRLYKIPSDTAAFSRRVAFLLAGTRSDARVRACVASQLTSMAHPMVATARQMAGCVMVGPEVAYE